MPQTVPTQAAKKISITRGEKIAARIIARLNLHGREWAEVVGSIRRLKPMLKDIDICTSLTIPEVAARIGIKGEFDIDRRFLQTKLYGVTVDFFRVSAGERPYAQLHHTGSREFNIAVRSFAKKRGWRLSQFGLFIINTDKRVPGSERLRTERSVLAFIGFPWHEPWERSPA